MSKLPFPRRGPQHALGDTAALPAVAAVPEAEEGIDLRRRRDQLSARLAELQWDLGGLTYEMATRATIRVDVLMQRAAILQDVDSELAEVERILRMEDSGVAGTCAVCRAPHSSGATFCWQCGAGLLPQAGTAA
jgi:hypothetical protein